VETNPGLDLRGATAGRALLLGSAAFLCALPSLFLQLTAGPPSRLLQEKAQSSGLSLPALALQQLLLLWFLLFFCALLAAVLARRYRLPGLGLAELAALLKSRRGALLLACGLSAAFALHLAGYDLYEGAAAQLIPELYPRGALAAALKGLMNAATLTVVGRLGLLTVALGAVRRPAIANALVSLFFCFLLVHTLQRYGVLGLAGQRLPLALAAVFFSNVLFNWIYLRSGLALSCFAQLLWEARFVTFTFLLAG
jgi:hypothetical protein